MKQFILMAFFSLFSLITNAQENKLTDNRSSLFLHSGTLISYGTQSLGYESPSLFANKEKHDLFGKVGFGTWIARIGDSNRGAQSKLGLTYLFGGNAHHLELGLGLTFHFDKGLKGQFLTYIDKLPHSFIGYRYQKPGKKIWFKIGGGWYEAAQVGIGFRL